MGGCVGAMGAIDLDLANDLNSYLRIVLGFNILYFFIVMQEAYKISLYCLYLCRSKMEFMGGFLGGWGDREYYYSLIHNSVIKCHQYYHLMIL